MPFRWIRRAWPSVSSASSRLTSLALSADVEPDEEPEEDDGVRDDEDLDGLARELFGPDPFIFRAQDDVEGAPTPGSACARSATPASSRGSAAGGPSYLTIEDLVRILGVAHESTVRSSSRAIRTRAIRVNGELAIRVASRLMATPEGAASPTVTVADSSWSRGARWHATARALGPSRFAIGVHWYPGPWSVARETTEGPQWRAFRLSRGDRI